MGFRIYYFIVFFIILFPVSKMVMAQENTFSKTYLYNGDSVDRREVPSGRFILVDSNRKTIIFQSISIAGFRTYIWYKVDWNGNIINQKVIPPEVLVDSTDTLNHYTPFATLYADSSKNFIFSLAKVFKVVKVSMNDGMIDYVIKRTVLSIQKRDLDFNLIWEKEYPMDYNNFNALSALVVNDSQLFILPLYYNFDTGSGNAYMIPQNRIWCFDTSGNMQWQKTIDSTEWVKTFSIVKDNDNNLLICGETQGYGSNSTNAIVFKTDLQGNKIWHKVLPGSLGSRLYNIQVDNEENIICIGYAAIPPAIGNKKNSAGRICKLDTDGNTIWDKLIDLSPSGEEFSSGFVLGDNSIIAFGNTDKYQSDVQFDYQVGSTRRSEGLVVKLSKDGDSLWTRIFKHSNSPYVYNFLYESALLPDGSFLAYGFTQLPVQAPWLVRLDSNGCFAPDCPNFFHNYDTASVDTPQPPPLSDSIWLYPNPSQHGQSKLICKLGFPENSQMVITDLLGRTILPLQSIAGATEILLKIPFATSGVYIVRIRYNGNIKVIKWVVQ
ncbi:MAG TPA: T9SS type A sorting domain-containing protein [Edaphocola sp.]|nr:T9SS type A sorting domain-containing protein [Edaphocola sp.]